MSSPFAVLQRGSACALLCCCTFNLTALAHTDDPKGNEQIVPYPGPGYRAADPPEDGLGVQFEADKIDLLSWITLSEFGIGFNAANDCWGYVSPSGREYALIGLDRATAFVDITEPDNAAVLGTISGPNSVWRDVKTYDQYAYVVTEGNGGGLQIISLKKIDQGIVEHVQTIEQIGSDKTHNVAIDEVSGYLYRTGGSYNGLAIYDIHTNPESPALVGTWPDRYVHDAQVVTYTSGPYAGRQIAFCCSGFNGGWVDTGLDILDVTDKDNILLLSRHVYNGGVYSHQGWLSPDRRFFYLGDELDEDGSFDTRTFIYDVTDLENPTFHNYFEGTTRSISHNIYVRDNLIFEANYTGGLRVYDATYPESPGEVAYFDTYPANDNASFNGLWSNYPFFPSGTIIGSDRSRGLFVWRLRSPKRVPQDYWTVQSAVDAAVDGDIVRVAPGRYPGTVDFGGKAIEVVAAVGPEMTVIDAEQQGTAVMFKSGEGPDSIINGFTLTNGTGALSDIPGIEPPGGAVYVAFTSPTIENCHIVDNEAANGGGLYLYESEAVVRDCVISGNQALNGGGIFIYGSSPTITGSEISSNDAQFGGGIFGVDLAWPDIDGTTFCNNTPEDIDSYWADGGDNSFVSQCPSLPLPSGWMIEAADDFDGDGDTDLFWIHTLTNLRYLWYIHDNDVVNHGPVGALEGNWSVVGTGDFNGDGKNDLLWHHAVTGQTSMWFMGALGITGSATLGAVPTVWKIETVGDFNGDGTADILWRRSPDGKLSLWFIDDAAVAGFGSPGTVNQTWSLAQSGDFDGDDKTDLFWRKSNGQNSIWLMNGASAKKTGSPGSVGTAWEIIGSPDTNGDGQSDVLWRHQDSGLLFLWIMKGTSIRKAAAIGNVGEDWVYQGQGQFVSSGSTELIWRNADTNDNVVWLINSTEVHSAIALPDA